MSGNPHSDPDPATRRLRALAIRRRQIVEIVALERARLARSRDPEIVDSCRDVIALLRDRRRILDAQVREAACATEDGARRMALLQTLPGVGLDVAAELVAELPELGALHRGAIASLAGLAPHGGQQSARGRSCVRAALYAAAMANLRSPAGFRAEYLALREAGKPRKVAVVAIARKMVVTLNAMMREGSPWSGAPTQGV